MCGIFGFVSAGQQPATVVLDGLKFLEYRGYDSWGIAVERGGTIETEKHVGQIALAHTTLPASAAAIGHTRWATHGGVTQANAHPHVDCGGRFALIHNGIVENYQDLGARLAGEHTFRSQTDTEVLVHLLEEELERQPGLLPALLTVFRLIEGLSAVAVLDSQTGKIAVAKNGSPLALGWAGDTTLLASDPNALLEHTRRITFLEDGQAAELSREGARVFDVATGKQIDADRREVNWDSRRAGLDGHPHFMSKEIHEQPRVLREIAGGKRGPIETLAAMISASDDIHLIGCGTAHHAAMSARYFLAEIAGIRSNTAVGSEMSLVLPALGPSSLVIAFSQSGETIDVLEAVRAARARGATVAAVVNQEGSALDRFADHSVLLGCGPERCVLATKSYTGQLAVMQLAAWQLAGDYEHGADDLRRAAYRLDSLLAHHAEGDRIPEVAQHIVSHQHLFILGRHHNYPLALEAALKIKEVSYLHAEGFAAGELKHGVIALIAPGTPCIVLAPDPEFRGEALAAAAEVRARGAYTIGLSPEGSAEFDAFLPVTDTVSAPYEIAAVCQLLAYELALLRGCDPDKPRNLAKSVTVK